MAAAGGLCVSCHWLNICNYEADGDMWSAYKGRIIAYPAQRLHHNEEEAIDSLNPTSCIYGGGVQDMATGWGSI